MEMIMKAVLMILLANLILGVVLWYRVRKLYRYPNVLGFPVIGNLYYFYRTLFIFSINGYHNYEVSITKKLEEGYGFHWVYGGCVVLGVFNPDLAKKLSLHPNLADKSKEIYGGLHSILGGPFGRPDSDYEWKVMRKDYNNSLKRSRVDNDYYGNFIRGANELVDMISASTSSSGFDAHAVFSSFSLDIAMKYLFGCETSLVYHPDVFKLFEKLNTLGSVLGANATSIRVLYPLLKPIFDFFLGKTILEIRRLGEEEAYRKLISNQCPPSELPLSALVVSRHNRNNTRGKVLDELTELYVTSSHTISSALSNTSYFLATLSDIQERAWQEQNEIFGDDKRDPTIDDLKQMRFLDRFIEETLRFTGPTFLAKQASADIIIDELTIPRNTTVLYLLGYMRFHPKYWKNPNVFDPDRFLEESDLLKHCSTPFGIGIRHCPGVYFATTLIKITLSKMIRRLKLRPVEKGFRFENIKFENPFFAEVANPPKLQIEERV